MKKNTVEKKEFSLKEYFEWRNNNEKITYHYLINFMTIMIGLIMLVILVLWMTGQLPTNTVTKICTTTTTSMGGV